MNYLNACYFVECVQLLCFFTEAIPIPADQPIMQIKDLDEVVIPTVEIKVRSYLSVCALR